MHGPMNVKFINESNFSFNMNALTLEGKMDWGFCCFLDNLHLVDDNIFGDSCQKM